MDDKRVEELVLEIIGELGYDKTEYAETARRVASMYREMMTQDDGDGELKMFSVEGYGDMTLFRDIPFYSLCEHHILPFFGTVDVAYISPGNVFGASKIPRLVRKCSRGLNMQEKITMRVADEIYETIQGEPKGCMVIVHAAHTCMSMRGARMPAVVTTSALRGLFMSPNVKMEALTLLANSGHTGANNAFLP
ncbi:MAG: GTP cyclohydrolase I [Thermoproteota archaeon]